MADHPAIWHGRFVKPVVNPLSPSEELSIEPYRLRTWGLKARNAFALLPLGLGLYWLFADYWNDRLTWGTWALSGVVIVAGLFGLAYVLTPVELFADRHGVEWRQFGWRKTIPWAQIEDIGVGRHKGIHVHNRPTGRAFTGVSIGHLGSVGTLGLNLRNNNGRDSGTAAYRRGFTGFELNFHNVFDVSTETIEVELRRRLELFRQGSPGA
ncbi:MAG: hypothetical protein DCF28_00830 [Alphaproteobacteria bacterium]|nr:MAG: hypothetical protein DCF28_00830 [Alphaproteobacteria bacterium]PZO39150.1 MAG: hypothetical protein DCE92_04730 [Alphaproteobacteria bacterium]